MEDLLYVSHAVMQKLRSDVAVNEARYCGEGFSDMVTVGWSNPTSLKVDVEALKGLDSSNTPDTEVRNSLCVWAALPGMTAAVATEGRIWTRLAHVEAFEFSRARWLRKGNGWVDGDALVPRVREHFFGDTTNRARDDHSIGRYWWSAYIASRVADHATSMEQVLRVILAKADIRLNFIERTEVGSQAKLSRAIVRHVRSRPFVAENEDRFRTFMKQVNASGGGLLFECMSDAQVDEFVTTCSPAQPTT